MNSNKEILIDKVFSNSIYNLVPDILKKEWRQIMNIQNLDYYYYLHAKSQQNSHYRLDYYKEEIIKYDRVRQLNDKIMNELIKKHINNKNYTEELKKSYNRLNKILIDKIKLLE